MGDKFDEFKELMNPAAAMKRAAGAASDEDLVRNVDVQALYLEVRANELALQESLDREARRLQSLSFIG